jgi:serine/threonine protein kinase
MGEVHRAHDTRHDRPVALKLLLESLSKDHDFRERFHREAAITAKLRDPHVIPIHNYGEIDGRLYLDMRLVDGDNLATVLARDGALEPARAVLIVEQIASALDTAHEDGLIHRDVKPSNVLLVTPRLGRADFCYLVDFGIAHSASTSTRSKLTATGTMIGTFDYMAPERFLAQPADHRGDVYAVTCLLYECLTGHRPFPGDDLPPMMHAHLNLAPPRPSDRLPALPDALDDVITTGMAKKPEDRYPSAGELAIAARSAITPVPTAPAPAPITTTAPTAAPASPPAVTALPNAVASTNRVPEAAAAVLAVSQTDRAPKVDANNGPGFEASQATPVLTVETTSQSSYATTYVPDAQLEAPRRSNDRSKSRLVATSLLAAVLLGASFYTWTRSQHVAEQDNLAFVDKGASDEAISQVSKDLETIYSYDFSRLDQSESQARSVLTGPFTADFDRTFAPVRELAPQRKAVVSATVAASGLKSLTPTHSNLLVMMNQSGSSVDGPIPGSSSRLDVTAEKIGTQWKVSGVTPE